MATVYLADDLRHNRRVAVKVLHPELAATVGPTRFLREIEVAAQLQHPHILGVLDSGDADGVLYYVMPFVEGQSLRDRISEAPLSMHEAVRILVQVIDALGAAHRSGIVHRDIKPDNVLMSGRHALVADFGVAKAVTQLDRQVRATLTTVGVALGTPAYMAPEQAAAEPDVDHRADLYAVGVMAFELLTGSLPFTGTGQSVLAAHIAEKPRRLRLLKPTIPFALEDVVLKCLAKRPRDRWQSAEELQRQLEAFQTASGGIVISKEVARAVAEKVRRPIIGVPVAALLVLALFGANEFRARRAAVRLANSDWLPRIQAFADSGDWESATALARQAQKVIPDSPDLADLWQRFSFLISMSSEPSGAKVFRRAYTAPDSAWEALGTTPIDSVRYPYGLSVVRLELPGYVPVERAMGWTVEANQPLGRLNPFKLDTEETLPAGMVRVPRKPPEAIGFDTGMDDFFIGKYEVTNREYKEFIAAGGYEKHEYWEQPIVRSGVDIPWQRAVALFVDRTGRPGPATWEAGDYPNGQSEYPVGGVSWYEAAAYAKFAGKELPTVTHWRTVSPGAGDARWLWPASNLDGIGPAPVGSFRGVFTGLGLTT